MEKILNIFNHLFPIRHKTISKCDNIHKSEAQQIKQSDRPKLTLLVTLLKVTEYD